MENIQKEKFRQIDSFHLTSFMAWTSLHFLTNYEKEEKKKTREIVHRKNSMSRFFFASVIIIQKF